MPGRPTPAIGTIINKLLWRHSVTKTMVEILYNENKQNYPYLLCSIFLTVVSGLTMVVIESTVPYTTLRCAKV